MTLKAGDKAMVVWGCCEQARKLIGLITTIESLCEIPTHCMTCNSVLPKNFARFESGKYFPVSWLIRMPPDEDQKDRIHEDDTVMIP